MRRRQQHHNNSRRQLLCIASGSILGAIVSGCREDSTTASSPATRATTTHASTRRAAAAGTTRQSLHEMGYRQPRAGIQLQSKTVDSRRYALFAGEAHARWGVTLERPSEHDRQTLLCVPGTYTSPKDDVEGLVMVDGMLLRKKRLAWEALLVIDSKGEPHNQVRIQHANRDSFARAALRRFMQAGATLLQGHMLVSASEPRPLKPSPSLQRRALMVSRGRAVVVESVWPVGLAQFASDLVALGAEQAMNLDMGKWSQGWYRREDGSQNRIGHNGAATDRQSNWLVLRAPS